MLKLLTLKLWLILYKILPRKYTYSLLRPKVLNLLKLAQSPVSHPACILTKFHKPKEVYLVWLNVQILNPVLSQQKSYNLCKVDHDASEYLYVNYEHLLQKEHNKMQAYLDRDTLKSEDALFLNHVLIFLIASICNIVHFICSKFSQVLTCCKEMPVSSIKSNTS